MITSPRTTDRSSTINWGRRKANVFSDNSITSHERIVLIAREYVPQALKSNIESIMCQGCNNLCTIDGDNVCRKSTIQGYWPGVEAAGGLVVSCEERVLGRLNIIAE
jgi:hypothetical protein